jgi:hypothetical protein
MLGVVLALAVIILVALLMIIIDLNENSYLCKHIAMMFLVIGLIVSFFAIVTAIG